MSGPIVPAAGKFSPPLCGRQGNVMTDRYDAKSALDDLKEDAVLPHPVRLRDMILRVRLGANEALEINREFQDYLAAFGQTQKIAHDILEKLAAGNPKDA
jgi:hypothetical protein